MEIAYICIFAGNFEESIEFYKNILGLEEDLKRSTPHFHALKAGLVYIGIELNGIRKIGQKTKAENPVLIQFKAESMAELENFTQELESKSVKILDRLKHTTYGTLTSFLDPDGNKLEMLFQNVSV